MKTTDIRQLSDDELAVKLADLKQAALKLRFKHTTAQLEQTSELRNNRRAVARVMTVINERTAAAAAEAK